jgi:hypothetical protein
LLNMVRKIVKNIEIGRKDKFFTWDIQKISIQKI